MKWTRITEKLPPEGQQILIYRRGTYEIGTADIFANQPRWYEDPEDAARLTTEEIANFRRIDDEQIGRVKVFGQSYYFNDRDLYWMAVPKPPPDDIICGAV